jgi:chitosanase
VGEKVWIDAYVRTRHHWLSTHSRSDLRPTVYRMDAFLRLIDLDLWGLELPLVVRGQEISIATLNAPPTGCYDGPQPGTRLLALQSPLLRGLDVRLLQLGLSRKGFSIRADGVFGNASLGAIKACQTAHNLPANGVADIALIAQLVG